MIFVLLLLNSIRQIWFSSSIDLLRSENTGEKPPKANWLLALAGALILGTAYWLALSIQDPLSAMMWFIVAVILVIVATYLLFVAGSVVLCRLLQKNKKYYYKTNHFVSVSSMIYRMKRNGGGLASICILSTMVLVMLSAVTCLYGGKENVLSDRYPRDLIVQITEPVFDEGQVFDEEREEIRKDFENIVKENNRETEKHLRLSVGLFPGLPKWRDRRNGSRAWRIGDPADCSGDAGRSGRVQRHDECLRKFGAG